MRKLLVGFSIVAGLLLVAFLALRTPDIPAETLRARYASPASQFVEVSPGFTVHLRDEGRRGGPTLLLIHGSNASLHTWEPWVARLGDRFRIVTLDLQGHGLTGPIPSGCYSRACMVETVEAVRARLGIAQMAIGGNSMGGGVALGYALSHRDRVTALILVDAAGSGVGRSGSPPIGFRIASAPGLRNLAAVITPRPLVAETLGESVSVKSVANEAAVDRYWQLLRHPGNRTATIARFSAPPSAPPVPAALEPLRGLPVLILWGADDAVIPVAAADWFQAALPEARRIIYPAIGHLPHEEAPDRSAADVAAFLAAS